MIGFVRKHAYLLAFFLMLLAPVGLYSCASTSSLQLTLVLLGLVIAANLLLLVKK